MHTKMIFRKLTHEIKQLKETMPQMRNYSDNDYIVARNAHTEKIRELEALRDELLQEFRSGRK